MNIFIKVRFFTTKKDGSTGPTAWDSDGPYSEIMGHWPGPTINLKSCNKSRMVHCTYHGVIYAQIQKVLSEQWSQLWQHFFFFFLRWWGYPNTTKRGVIISQPAKRHLNGVSLAGRLWPNIECWLSSFVNIRGSGPVLLRNHIYLWFSRGRGILEPLSRPPPPPPPLSIHTWQIRICNLRCTSVTERFFFLHTR